MRPNTRSHLLAATLLMAAATLMSADPLMAAPPVPPDLTQGAAVDRKLTYNLGATGLRGWIFNKNDKNYGNSSYSGLSPAATYVRTYALPLKKLRITGKTANQANWPNKQQVAGTIASGRFDLDRKNCSAGELVAALGDWSPMVRGRAAEALASRPEAKAMVPELITLAEGKDVHVAQGATERYL